MVSELIETEWQPSGWTVLGYALGIGWIAGGIECWLLAARIHYHWTFTEAALTAFVMLLAGGLLSVVCALPSVLVFKYSTAEVATDRLALSIGCVTLLCSVWLNTGLVQQLWVDERQLPAIMVGSSNLLFASLAWQNGRYWLRRRLVYGKGRLRWWWVSALMALVLSAGGVFAMVGQQRGSDRAISSEPDVTVIVVDGLRADAVLGRERSSTPNIDRLASESIVYHQAVSPAPLSLPSQVALLFGIYPAQVGLVDNSGPVYPGLPSLMSSLEAEGYATSAFWTSSVFANQSELSRGFQLYDDDSGGPIRALGETMLMRRFSQLIGASASPRTNSQTLQRVISWLEAYSANPALTIVQLELEGAQNEGEYKVAVTSLDASLAPLLSALAQREQSRPQLVVLTAGRGMMLGEHKFWGLSDGIYEGNVHVPLMIKAIRGSSIGKSRNVNEAVRTLDVMNTLLWQLELSNVNTSQSADIIQYLDRPDFVGNQAMLIGGDIRDFDQGLAYGLRQQHQAGLSKIVYFPGRNRWALYDLSTDSAEHEDLSESSSAQAQNLLKTLRAALEKLPKVSQPIRPSDDLQPEGYASW